MLVIERLQAILLSMQNIRDNIYDAFEHIDEDGELREDVKDLDESMTDLEKLINVLQLVEKKS